MKIFYLIEHNKIFQILIKYGIIEYTKILDIFVLFSMIVYILCLIKLSINERTYVSLLHS